MIYYLTPTPPTLSETFIVDELRVLRDLGVDVRAVALNPGTTADAGTRSIRARARPWTSLLARRWYRLAAWLLAVWRLRGTQRWVILRSLDLAALWLRERPARVHAHFVDETAVAAVLACRLWCVPVSGTAHARDIFDSPPRRLRVLARYGVRFVAVCRYNRDALIARGVPADAIAVIPCGTDTTGDDFPARTAGEYDGTLRVLVVARLVAKKGIDDLLQAVTDEAVAALVDEVRVIGDGPDRERMDLLAEEARRAGVRVSFLGPAPREQHAASLRWANLSCLPCKVAPDGDRDSMPVAIKEALVARVPVLTTTAVGIPEMVDDGTAIIVDPGDPAAIARGLRTYAGLSAAQRAALAEAGRRRVTLRFDLVDTVGAVKDFLLENARPQRWESDA